MKGFAKSAGFPTGSRRLKSVRLTPQLRQTLGKYLSEIERLWPYQQFHFHEETALHYLHLKNYDVALALTTVTYNQDQLIQLLSGKLDLTVRSSGAAPQARSGPPHELPGQADPAAADDKVSPSG
jgi:hypothetical protein